MQHHDVGVGMMSTTTSSVPLHHYMHKEGMLLHMYVQMYACIYLPMRVVALLGNGMY